MHLLALDIGLKRTGVAFGDTKSGIVVALDTFHCSTATELATKVERLVQEKKIDSLVIGLPLLLSGEEGEQSGLIRDAADVIKKLVAIPVEFIDERYTTKTSTGGPKSDPDAFAACAILTVKMDQKNAIDM